MNNNSSETAGWLTPVSDDPAYDNTLEEYIKGLVQGICGLDENYIISVDSANFSSVITASENSCAFTLNKISTEGDAALVNQQEEKAELYQNEIIECLLHFYGSAAQGYAARFRDGSQLSQNHAQLQQLSLGIREFSPLTTASELINDTRKRRYEMTVTLVRKIVREYGIHSLVATPVTIFGE